MQLTPMEGNPGATHSQPHGGSGSQIRSRVTVVCAECKRLKLKCDRRTPCSSCLKRDTVPRCTYSAAAAEKIDVQSLHNRVLALESQLSQLTSGRIKSPSHDLDHALLAVGSSGSSVLVPLDDVAGLWLEHIGLGRDSSVELQPVCLGAASLMDLNEKREAMQPAVSLGGSIHNSPHVALDTPFLSLPDLYNMSRHSVTPALLSLLPSAQHRPTLLNILTSVLRMHPCLNFPHYRARVNAMFNDGNCPEEIGIGPSHVDHMEKPTLTFFAAVAAGFALAIQCSSKPIPSLVSSPHASPSPPSSQLLSVPFLLTLSGQVLEFVENSMSYDLDFLHALVLRCLCLLHDGMPRVSQTVFATLGKMVNIARLMGLARDPDEFTCGSAAKYSLWEAEMRRRMWWDIFYYDLFISDCMGFAPLISDDQHTCRMPADVDEDAFLPKSVTLPQPTDHICENNFSYFIQKCKLAQLVKNMKKRVCHDPSSSPTSTPQEPKLEAAVQAESEIQQYLVDLPPAFKLDVDVDAVDPAYPLTPSTLPPTSDSETPPHLIVQRCELVAIAHQLILKLFHPFLRRLNVRPLDNAMIASVNACHTIIHASRIAQGVWQRQRNNDSTGCSSIGAGSAEIPSSHGVFYPFARQLFDATIVAAHVVIQVPQSVVAKVALDDVRIALDVLRKPTLATGRGRTLTRGGLEDCPSEAVTIVEMMLRKAEMEKRNYVSVAAGVKRKHEEMEPSVGRGFWLPYMGTGVATESTSSSSNLSSGGNTSGTSTVEYTHGSPQSKPSEKVDNQTPHPPMMQRVAPPSMPSLKGDKERRYSVVGSRGRTVVRRRNSSVSISQTLGNDSDGYGKSVTSTSSPTLSRASDAVQESSLSATYKVEGRPTLDVHLSPTSGYSPQPQPQSQLQPQPRAEPRQSHGFGAHSFHSLGGSSATHHQPLYDSGAYESESSRESGSFYVPYNPPSSQSAFRTISGSEQPHAHSHAPQHPPHAHMELINVIPSQNTMDTSRVAKQEQGLEKREGQPHLASNPYPGSDGWSEPAGMVRYPPQTHWDPGYNY